MQKCPVCGSKKTDFFHEINSYRYFICHNCETLFLNPQPSVKSVASFYTKDFNFSAGEHNESEIRKRAVTILKNLKRLNPAGRSLLDIGSGFGYFLAEAGKFNLKLSAVEPSHKLYSLSIRRYKNVSVFNSDFSGFLKENQGKKYDFITLIHTIEHLSKPEKTIRDTVKLLNRNGILYLETPNLKSRLFATEKQFYTFLTPPEHIWIFSLNSLKKMLSNNNDVRIVKFSTYSQPEHLMGILKKIIRYPEKINFNKEVGSANPSLYRNISRSQNESFISDLKYRIIDRNLAPFFTPLLNLGGYGSILELYLRKD